MRSANDAAKEVRHRRAAEGKSSGQRLEDNHTEAEDVRPSIDVGITARLLRRHITRRAEDAATLALTLGVGRVVGCTHTEVQEVHDELTLGAPVEQDVLRLHVPEWPWFRNGEAGYGTSGVLWSIPGQCLTSRWFPCTQHCA